MRACACTSLVSAAIENRAWVLHDILYYFSLKTVPCFAASLTLPIFAASLGFIAPSALYFFSSCTITDVVNASSEEGLFFSGGSCEIPLVRICSVRKNEKQEECF